MSGRVHIGTLQVRPRLGKFVVYDNSDTSRRPRPARFCDGKPAIFAEPKEAFLWCMQRVSRHIGETPAPRSLNTIARDAQATIKQLGRP